MHASGTFPQVEVFNVAKYILILPQLAKKYGPVSK